jgi:glucose-6-phosphate dehydrogenase assembly protein OpcA
MADGGALGRWSGEGVSIAEIERRLAELRQPAESADSPELRTSVMTHIAWVPAEWEQAAAVTRSGLGARHPSRAIVLYPKPDDGDRLDATVSVEAYDLPGLECHVSAEVIELSLRGAMCVDPASVVAPLLMADLPVFLRWRGRPSFTGAGFERILVLVDRLIVNSMEWPDVPGAYADLAGCFGHAACSDIAWRRTERWRVALAGQWPGIAELSQLRVEGPLPEAFLLAGWLRSRLGRDVELEHTVADTVIGVEVDGRPVPVPVAGEPTPSDLLSAELDVLEREPVYEEAALAAADMAPIAA